MARKVTTAVVAAFLNGQKKTVGNTHTDGKSLFLHGNRIATIDDRGYLLISTAGWGTPTTKERLNALPHVSVSTKNFKLYLNGKEWDGTWTAVAKVKAL